MLSLDLAVRLRTAGLGSTVEDARRYADPGERVVLHVWRGLHDPSVSFVATLLDLGPSLPILHRGGGWDQRPYPPHQLIERHRPGQGWSSLAAAVCSAAIDWPYTIPARLAIRPLGLYAGAQYLYHLEHLGDVPSPYPPLPGPAK